MNTLSPTPNSNDIRLAQSFATGDWVISGVDTETHLVYLKETHGTTPESLPVETILAIVTTPGTGAFVEQTAS